MTQLAQSPLTERERSSHLPTAANKPRPAPQRGHTGTAGKQTDGGSVHCIATFVAGVEEAVEGRLESGLGASARQRPFPAHALQ